MQTQPNLYRRNAHPYYQAQAVTCTICGQYKRGGEIITTSAADIMYREPRPQAHYLCLKEADKA